MKKILVIDDDAELRQLLATYLGRHGFDTLLLPDSGQLDAFLARYQPQLLVLDLMLPGEDGLAACRRLRARGERLPVIMLTAKDSEIDKVVGLEVGADDYVTKPFNPRELLARVKSLLRRSAARPAEAADSLRFAGWVLEPSRRRLRDRAGQDVALTRGEFEVLALLVRHPGEILDRDRLSRAVSGHDWSPQDRSVDVLVRRLRAKLDDPARADSLIATIRGEGYRLAVDVEPGGS